MWALHTLLLVRNVSKTGTEVALHRARLPSGGFYILKTVCVQVTGPQRVGGTHAFGPACACGPKSTRRQMPLTLLPPHGVWKNAGPSQKRSLPHSLLTRFENLCSLFIFMRQHHPAPGTRKHRASLQDSDYSASAILYCTCSVSGFCFRKKSLRR